MDYTVEVANLTKQFGKFTAVNDISFSVTKGEIFGFLGPNGAGKSTTIKILCGIFAPTSGSGHVSGFDIISGQNNIKANIGYMSQKFSLYDDLSVLENLEFFGSIYNLDDKKLKTRIRSVLDLAGISNRKDDLVRSLPAGIKQRLALGTSIIHDPAILFLDEPTSGVDPIMRRNFWELIYQFSEAGKTIFVTTHYMDEAEHCDRIALIIAGKIIALDSPEGLKKSLPYSVHALRVKDFIKVFDTLSGQKFIREASIFGSDIHLLCERETKLKEELRKFFDKKGISDYLLEEIQPTLEDVFVTNAKRIMDT